MLSLLDTLACHMVAIEVRMVNFEPVSSIMTPKSVVSTKFTVLQLFQLITHKERTLKFGNLVIVKVDEEKTLT